MESQPTQPQQPRILRPHLNPQNVSSSPDELTNALERLESRSGALPGAPQCMEMLIEIEQIEQLLDWGAPPPEPRQRLRQVRCLLEQRLFDWAILWFNESMAAAPPATPPAAEAQPEAKPAEKKPVSVKQHAPPPAAPAPIEKRLPAIAGLSEVAQILGVAPPTIRNWILNGMPAHKGRNGRWKIKREDVIYWIGKLDKA